MYCLDVQAELEAYVDGELGLDRSARVEGHLASCRVCQAELARLRAVEDVMETWPLVTEPAQFTAQVMARLRPRPARLHFRLHWSDLVVSVMGAGLASAAMLLWRYPAPADLAYLHPAQIYLGLERLQLDVLLVIQHVVRTNIVPWGLLLGGVVSLAALIFVVWDLHGGKRGRSFL
jgi:predicted anti-sigma-YlaC factor YlaD